MTTSDFTLYPRNAAAAALDRYDADRVLVRLPNQTALSDTWTATVDGRSGLPIEVRRADCGGGCRCAGEVRVLRRVAQ